MIRRFLWVALAAFSFAFFYAKLQAQQVTGPTGPQVTLVCAYNSSPPTITAGNLALVQCDSSGNIITSGGGGGGGAVTVANGADVAQGNTADAAYTGSGTSTIIAALKGLYAAATSPIPMPVNITPTDCSTTVTVGGTAQVLITAQTALHGFTVANIDATSGSGEPLWVSFTGTAAASTAASYPLAPPTSSTSFAGMGSYTTPVGFGMNHAVSILGATTGHKISCTWW